MGGSSLNISSHSSRHSSQIRLSSADAIAATWSRRLPQKLHCSVPASSLTIRIVVMGVRTVRLGSAMTASARLTQASQMYACGPAISFSTCFWRCPQNEHDRRFAASDTHPLYPGSGAGIEKLLGGRPDHQTRSSDGRRRQLHFVPIEGLRDPRRHLFRQCHVVWIAVSGEPGSVEPVDGYGADLAKVAGAGSGLIVIGWTRRRSTCRSKMSKRL
jgi:hypothetical protein